MLSSEYAKHPERRGYGMLTTDNIKRNKNYGKDSSYESGFNIHQDRCL